MRKVDVVVARLSVLQIRGAAQQVYSVRFFAMQRQTAGTDALEVQDVVHQADEAVTVANGHIQHLRKLFRTLLQHSDRRSAERGAQRGQRRAQLMAHRGD